MPRIEDRHPELAQQVLRRGDPVGGPVPIPGGGTPFDDLTPELKRAGLQPLRQEITGPVQQYRNPITWEERVRGGGFTSHQAMEHGPGIQPVVRRAFPLTGRAANQDDVYRARMELLTPEVPAGGYGRYPGLDRGAAVGQNQQMRNIIRRADELRAQGRDAEADSLLKIAGASYGPEAEKRRGAVATEGSLAGKSTWGAGGVGYGAYDTPKARPGAEGRKRAYDLRRKGYKVKYAPEDPRADDEGMVYPGAPKSGWETRTEETQKKWDKIDALKDRARSLPEGSPEREAADREADRAIWEAVVADNRDHDRAMAAAKSAEEKAVEARNASRAKRGLPPLGQREMPEPERPAVPLTREQIKQQREDIRWEQQQEDRRRAAEERAAKAKTEREKAAAEADLAAVEAEQERAERRATAEYVSDRMADMEPEDVQRVADSIGVLSHDEIAQQVEQSVGRRQQREAAEAKAQAKRDAVTTPEQKAQAAKLDSQRRLQQKRVDELNKRLVEIELVMRKIRVGGVNKGDFYEGVSEVDVWKELVQERQLLQDSLNKAEEALIAATEGTRDLNQEADAAVAEQEQQQAAAAEITQEIESKGKEQPAAPPTQALEPGLVAPKTQAEYDALPSGTEYLHPDGQIKVKP